jgi:hypothetical protein
MFASLGAFLQEKMSEFKGKNPRFSLRSFAAKVDISPGAFAELLHDKRPLSDLYAEKIITGLKLSASERELVYSFVSTKTRRMARQRILSEEELQLISSWEHYAILNLMKTSDFKSDPAWVADRLGLEVNAVKKHFQLLLQLGLIEVRRGRWVRLYESINTTQEIPSKALVRAHKQDLLKAIRVLQRTPPSVRSFTSTTMPISIDKLDQAKKLISKFHRQLCALLERGDKGEVYNLNVQLFPLTVLKRQSEKGLS